LCGSGFDWTKLVCRKFENRDLATAKILLVGEALVGSDEQIELAFSECELFAVLYAFPTDLLRGVALMTGKQFAQRRRDAFVEQYLHAG
jgi:hypothetical protein